MDSCTHFRELASAFIDGELTHEEEAAFRTHLEACPNCAQWYAMFSLLHEETTALAVDAPPELKGRVMNSVKMMSKKGPSIFSRFKFTAAAAVIVLIVFAASVPIHKYLPQHEQNAAQDTAGQLDTAEKQQDSLTDVPMTISGLPNNTTSEDQETAKGAGADSTTDITDATAEKNEEKLKTSGEQDKSDNRTTQPEGKGQTSAPPTVKTQPSTGTTSSDTPQNGGLLLDQEAGAGSKTEVGPPNSDVSKPTADAVQQPASGESSDSTAEDMVVPPVDPNNSGGAGSAGSTGVPPSSDAASDSANGSSNGVSDASGTENTTTTPDTIEGMGTQGSAGSENRAKPPIPYQEEFSFVLVLYQCDIPESLQKHQAELYQNNLYFIVDSNMKSTIVSDAKSNGISFDLFPGENSNVPHGLVILVNK